MTTYRQELIARIVQGMMAYYGPTGFIHEEAEKAACTIADDVIAREQMTRRAPTTAAEVAADPWPKKRVELLYRRLDKYADLLEAIDRRLDDVQGQTDRIVTAIEGQPTNLLREQINTKHQEAIGRRLDDMRTSLDRIVTAVETPNLDDLIARAAQRVEEKRLYKAPRGLFSAEERADPDNWLANHPRIRELSDEIDQLRKELYIQTGKYKR